MCCCPVVKTSVARTIVSQKLSTAFGGRLATIGIIRRKLAAGRNISAKAGWQRDEQKLQKQKTGGGNKRYNADPHLIRIFLGVGFVSNSIPIIVGDPHCIMRIPNKDGDGRLGAARSIA